MNAVKKEPSLDRTRPLELLNEKDAKTVHQLHYRYVDTGEEVLVPNIWYNQTVQMLIDNMQYNVDRQYEAYQKMKQDRKHLLSLECPSENEKRALREVTVGLNRQADLIAHCVKKINDWKNGVSPFVTN